MLPLRARKTTIIVSGLAATVLAAGVATAVVGPAQASNRHGPRHHGHHAAPTGPATASPSADPTTDPTATATTTADPAATSTSTSAAADLDSAEKKEIAMQLVSSAENSSLDWKAQYGYIEDIDDGRGYTGGIIGFTSGTHDMLELVENYTDEHPGNGLAAYLPALRAVDGSDSTAGLGSAYVKAWKAEAKVTAFQEAQNSERDRVYFGPAVDQAKKDGLRALGQFIYYDAIVMHGPGDDGVSFGGIRATALKKARTPAQGGDETAYLNAFLDARKAAMLTEEAHSETGRVDTMQRVFLKEGNLDLNPPLRWAVYGADDTYEIL
ncbi:chitosanase [Kineosporia succinea]|uniref:Chitosanase n=1 Tax=Kineosporia succinea TaxID=84632 RepID=A0ABT9P1J3_9ACTN|nr:chitosanase [Kineosporia succinea]MDP9826549.1 chitosanase [Kineosporia succinea]